MRFRIGYGGPKKYRHGYRGPRPMGGNMSEIERFIHLIVSLQILFGSRRGGLLLPLIIVGLAVGGWFAYNNFFGVNAALSSADAKWDSNDSSQKNQAVADYKQILQRKDFWNPEINALQRERDRLYRRIIQHHVIFDSNTDDARDWIKNAFDEQYTIRDMNFGDEAVKQMWQEVTEQLKRSGGQSDPSRSPSRDQNPFKSIPGLKSSSRKSPSGQHDWLAV